MSKAFDIVRRSLVQITSKFFCSRLLWKLHYYMVMVRCQTGRWVPVTQYHVIGVDWLVQEKITKYFIFSNSHVHSPQILCVSCLTENKNIWLTEKSCNNTTHKTLLVLFWDQGWKKNLPQITCSLHYYYSYPFSYNFFPLTFPLPLF